MWENQRRRERKNWRCRYVTWFRPAALADASIGRTHWGWSCLQYPFIGERKMTLIPRNAAPFKSYNIARPCTKVDVICTLFEKMKMYSGVWVSQPAACACVIWLTPTDRARTVSMLYLCSTQENQRPRQRGGQRAVVVCTCMYIPILLYHTYLPISTYI